MKPMLSFYRKEMLRFFRDRRFFILSLGMPIIFYLIFVNQVGSKQMLSGTTWKAYFMVSMAAFGIIASSVNALGVRLASERTSGWVRWLKTTPLSPTGYAVVKMLVQLSISLLIILVIFLIGVLFQGVTMPFWQWIAIFLWLWLASFPFAALGVLIGFAGNAAQILGTLIYLAISMLGGLWTPIQVLPSSMQTIAKWMPSYRYAHPAWNILAGQGIAWQDIAILLGYTIVFLMISVYVQKTKSFRRSTSTNSVS
nr:ABC transporter permease [Bacilli bacterium]